jgi:hypothetical protein
MQFPFLPFQGTVVFHHSIRKTTVHKNGHNLSYARCFI